VRRLDTIPGVDRVTACVLIAEWGVEMNQFPPAKHAASWAGLCPGNAESAGKRFSGKTRKGDRYLRPMLVQNAWAVSHMKNCFLTAVFYPIAAKCGRKKAAVAVAHRILTIAYHIIRDGTEYQEHGGDYCDRKYAARTALRLTRRLENIGYDAVLTPRPEAPSLKGAPRKRGRPCKCAEHALVCTHPHQRPAKPKPEQPPAKSEEPSRTCSRCAKWGLHPRSASKKQHEFFGFRSRINHVSGRVSKEWPMAGSES
jgi:Transposase IS116/IS110/IS902 family